MSKRRRSLKLISISSSAEHIIANEIPTAPLRPP
jgi:hypothetical protein